jgi:integrase
MMGSGAMAERINFVKAKLDSLAPTPNCEPCFYDIKQPGLLIRVRNSGRKSFEVRKKIKGRAVRTILGVYPEMTIEQARIAARKALNEVSEGKNPNKQADAKRAVQITLVEGLEEYLESRQIGKIPLRKNTVDCYRRSINLHLKQWRNRTVASITRSDVERKHRALTQHSQSAADYTMRVLRLVHNYVAEKYRDEDGRPILFDNPVSQLNQGKAWSEAKTRTNTIEDRQLAKWFEAVESMPAWLTHSSIDPEVTRNYFLFVLFSGLRRREASSIEHDWIDAEAKTLTIPGQYTKNHQVHSIPLSPFLMEIVSNQMSVSEQYLFENQSTGKAIAEPKRVVQQIRDKCGIYFTIHDLRRTFATIAGKIVARDYIVKRLLNHKPLKNDVTALNYVNLSVDDLREPMNAIAEHILLMAYKDRTNIVPLSVVIAKG